MNALAENSAPTNDGQTAVSFQRARRTSNKSYDLNGFCKAHCSSTSAEQQTKCDAATAAELKKAYDQGAGSSVLRSCNSEYKLGSGLAGYPKSIGKVRYM